MKGVGKALKRNKVSEYPEVVRKLQKEVDQSQKEKDQCRKEACAIAVPMLD
jgi:hypothetical protein